jgi:diguanylate cyclase (GGDEF)-like protein
MNLDLRTIMLVMAGINLLFAGLLALVGLHAGTVKGARQWALGDLCTAIGLGAAGMLTGPPSAWMLVALGIMLAAGLGLRYNGIEAFKGERCNYWIPFALAALVAGPTIWFSVLHDNAQGRIAANWMVFAVANAASAWALFVRIGQPLRTAYWLAAGSYSFIALVTFAMALVAALSPPGSMRMFQQSTFSPAVYFIGSMAQMSLSFALVLMINYRLADDLRELASTDALTGLLNRGSLEQAVGRMSALSATAGETHSVMMIDVDHFKKINDRYGHPAGDQVLRRLAALMQTMIRRGDHLGRYGGEEFCISLPCTGEAEAAAMAERLRQCYLDMRVEWGDQELRGSLSIGVADSRLAGAELSMLVTAADQALYQAKREGRNRVVLYSACQRSVDRERAA